MGRKKQPIKLSVNMKKQTVIGEQPPPQREMKMEIGSGQKTDDLDAAFQNLNLLMGKNEDEKRFES
jgi:hypothetical protein